MSGSMWSNPVSSTSRLTASTSSSVISSTTASAPSEAMVPLHVDDRLVERVAQGVAGVAPDEDGARLGHEAGHGPGVAGDGHGAALEGDPGPQGGVALDDDAPAPGAGPGALRRAAPDADGAAHEVLADRPPDEAVDDDVGPGAVPRAAQAAEEVAGVALDRDGDGVASRRPGCGGPGAGYGTLPSGSRAACVAVDAAERSLTCARRGHGCADRVGPCQRLHV